MRNLFKLVLLLLLVNVAFKSNAQSKKDFEIQISDITTKMDEMQKRLDALEIMYSATKDKILKKDFNPAKFESIIDSAKEKRNEDFAALEQHSKSATDSVKILQAKTQNLQELIDSLTGSAKAVKDEVMATPNKDAIIDELKQLKELVDSGILTQDEFDKKKQVLMENW